MRLKLSDFFSTHTKLYLSYMSNIQKLKSQVLFRVEYRIVISIDLPVLRKSVSVIREYLESTKHNVD